MDRITIEGPLPRSGARDTPPRRKVFVCKPASAKDETACATKILSSLTRLAYRRPVDGPTLDVVMGFYRQGRANGANFESGIESALQFTLASPEFLFRFEPDRPNLPS